MKKLNEQSPSRVANGWLMPVFIAVCAAGAGVTGTLLWVQSRAPAASGAASSTWVASAPASTWGGSSSSGTGAASAQAVHDPPATLTAGMAPAQAALTQGNWFYDHKEWPRAIELYRQAIAQGVDNPDVRTDLGSALRFSGEPQKALEQYRLAQKQNPRHENSLFNQGGVYASDLKQLDKAIVAWRKYLQAFPNGQSVEQARQLIAEAQQHSKHQAAGR